MRIAVDQNVPAAHEAFAQFGEVQTFNGRTLKSDALVDVDAIVVRSVTRVDASLLEKTPVRFVGTATIGTDHLDLSYLKRRGISVADAAGSNARSVAEYVVAALLELRARGALIVDGQSIGVVGVGHVGSQVAKLARALGMRVVEFDPPRAARDAKFASAQLDDVMNCDVITLHVPLIDGGEYPTRHLVDTAFLERMQRDSVLINTSRGSIVDSDALTRFMRRELIGHVVIDVWEGEPDVPRELVGRASIATPHIAGYSMDGKVRGTEMMVNALARFIGSTSNWKAPGMFESRADMINISATREPLDAARDAVSVAYDIADDDRELRAILTDSDDMRRAGFDQLRRDYRVRREFAAYGVTGEASAASAMLSRLGFMRLVRQTRRN